MGGFHTANDTERLPNLIVVTMDCLTASGVVPMAIVQIRYLAIHNVPITDRLFDAIYSSGASYSIFYEILHIYS